MPRRVFFSFHYSRDAWEVSQIRNAWVTRQASEAQPLLDKAQWETVKRRGSAAIRNWIDTQMQGSGVVCVLIGPETYTRPWVKYEITKAWEENRGLFGINLGGMLNQHRQVKSFGPNPFQHVPLQYKANRTQNFQIYNWQPNGRLSIGHWVERAAAEVGR